MGASQIYYKHSYLAFNACKEEYRILVHVQNCSKIFFCNNTLSEVQMGA